MIFIYFATHNCYVCHKMNKNTKDNFDKKMSHNTKTHCIMCLMDYLREEFMVNYLEIGLYTVYRKLPCPTLSIGRSLHCHLEKKVQTIFVYNSLCRQLNLFKVE